MSIYHRTSVVLLRSVHGARLFATTRTTARPADDADDYIERPRSRRVIPTDLLDAKPGPARAQSAEPTPTQNTIPTDPTPPLKPTQAGSTVAATPSAPVQPAIAAIDTLTAPLTQADKGTGSTLQPARRQPKLISQSLLDASLAADKLQPPQATEPTTNAASPKPQAPAAQKDSIDEPLERKDIDSDAADTTDTTGYAVYQSREQEVGTDPSAVPDETTSGGTLSARLAALRKAGKQTEPSQTSQQASLEEPIAQQGITRAQPTVSLQNSTEQAGSDLTGLAIEEAMTEKEGLEFLRQLESHSGYKGTRRDLAAGSEDRKNMALSLAKRVQDAMKEAQLAGDPMTTVEKRQRIRAKAMIIANKLKDNPSAKFAPMLPSAEQRLRDVRIRVPDLEQTGVSAATLAAVAMPAKPLRLRHQNQLTHDPWGHLLFRPVHRKQWRTEIAGGDYTRFSANVPVPEDLDPEKGDGEIQLAARAAFLSLQANTTIRLEDKRKVQDAYRKLAGPKVHMPTTTKKPKELSLDYDGMVDTLLSSFDENGKMIKMKPIALQLKEAKQFLTQINAPETVLKAEEAVAEIEVTPVVENPALKVKGNAKATARLTLS